MWDAATGDELLSLRGHTGLVYGVAYSPDGHRIASASQDKTVRVWDAASGQELLTLRGHSNEVYSIAYSPQGNRIAAVSQDGSLKVWDAATGVELRTVGGARGVSEAWRTAPMAGRSPPRAQPHLEVRGR